MAGLIRKILRIFTPWSWPHYDYQRQQIALLERQAELLEELTRHQS